MDDEENEDQNKQKLVKNKTSENVASDCGNKGNDDLVLREMNENEEEESVGEEEQQSGEGVEGVNQGESGASNSLMLLDCKICNKQFDNLHRLQRHAMCHDQSPELRKFKCDFCNKAFKFKHHLKVYFIGRNICLINVSVFHRCPSVRRLVPY